MSEPINDLAHIGHAELLTPFPEGSLRFFVDVFGMEIEEREGQSVYLRGWGDYQRYSLKLTESKLPGLGHMAIRAWSEQGLYRRVEAIEADRSRARLDRGGVGHGPAYQFTDPDGHAMELYYEAERYEPARHLRPALPATYGAVQGSGVAFKRLDHINVLTTRRSGQSPLRPGAAGLPAVEQVIPSTTAPSPGAWMSLTIAAQPLIYVADNAGAQRPPAPPRVLRRHARGMPACGGHLPRRRRPDRGRAVQARGRSGMFL